VVKVKCNEKDMDAALAILERRAAGWKPAMCGRRSTPFEQLPGTVLEARSNGTPGEQPVTRNEG